MASLLIEAIYKEINRQVACKYATALRSIHDVYVGLTGLKPVISLLLHTSSVQPPTSRFMIAAPENIQAFVRGKFDLNMAALHTLAL